VQFREATLDNGLQIVAELNPSAQSLAAGFFVRTGARDETPAVNGVSHFLEHMAFKGNERFTADDVNRIFDEVGAKYNASTSEEVTLYYAAILPEYLPRTFEILTALLYPTLRQDDFDMEKKVILEEIGMYEDQPTFTAYEELMRVHFAGHPLGQSILGSSESIQALSSEQMRTYHRDHYKAGNIVLAIAGRAEWDDVLKLVKHHC
jgi:predicted Zn-dependent peptidase